MTRVKRGKTKHKKREKLLKETKGFKWGRKNRKTLAKEALLHKWKHAFRGRKEKKRDNRRLWNIKINAGSRQNDLRYSEFMNLLAQNNIEINRKMLAELSEHEPEIFAEIVKKVKQ